MLGTATKKITAVTGSGHDCNWRFWLRGMNDVRILELSEVSLDAVLYYVNQDIPVLISLNDDSAVLVIGLISRILWCMDPEAGTVYKKGMNDSTKWFEER